MDGVTEVARTKHLVSGLLNRQSYRCSPVTKRYVPPPGRNQDNLPGRRDGPHAAKRLARVTSMLSSSWCRTSRSVSGMSPEVLEEHHGRPAQEIQAGTHQLRTRDQDPPILLLERSSPRGGWSRPVPGSPRSLSPRPLAKLCALIDKCTFVH